MVPDTQEGGRGGPYIARYCLWAKYRGAQYRKRFVPIQELTGAPSRN